MSMRRRTTRIFLVGAGAAALLAIAPAGAMGNPTPAGWDSGISPVPKANCRTGETPIVPSGATYTPHDGIKYTIDVGDGQPGWEIVPPAGFDPSAASDALLAEMNFAPRPPIGAADRAGWDLDMAAYQGFAPPAFCLGSRHRASLSRTDLPHTVQPNEPVGHTGSVNWAGYLNVTHSFGQAVTHFAQNSVQACGCVGPAAEASWVGIGKSTGLIQTGTEIFGSDGPQAFAEWISTTSAPPSLGLGPVGVGDSIAVMVGWNATHTSATFGLSDNGVVKLNMVKPLGPEFVDLATADFITERVSSATALYPLANFVQVNFSSARVAVFGATTLESFTAEPYESSVLTTNGQFLPPLCGDQHLMAHPENVNVQSFDVRWCRAG